MKHHIYRFASFIGLSYHGMEKHDDEYTLWPTIMWDKPSFIIKITNGFCILGSRQNAIFITKTYIKYQRTGEIIWCLHTWQIRDGIWAFLRKLGIRKPFKGCHAYELQTFMLVWQVYYPGNVINNTKWRANVWYDSFWLDQSFLNPLVRKIWKWLYA